MMDFKVGDYAIYNGREVKITTARKGLRSGKMVYCIEWFDRHEGRQSTHAIEGELSPVPDLTPPPVLHPAVVALRKLDIDSLSPIEALTKLYELKRMALK
jgi:hypothetical protein